MSNEKMREEFEAWYWINYQVKHSMSINEVFSMDSFDEYRLTIVSVAYDSWKSSRAALCVELPSKINDQSDKWSNGYDFGIDGAQDALEAAGVRHK